VLPFASPERGALSPASAIPVPGSAARGRGGSGWYVRPRFSAGSRMCVPGLHVTPLLRQCPIDPLGIPHRGAPSPRPIPPPGAFVGVLTTIMPVMGVIRGPVLIIFYFPPPLPFTPPLPWRGLCRGPAERGMSDCCRGTRGRRQFPIPGDSTSDKVRSRYICFIRAAGLERFKTNPAVKARA